MVSHSFQKLEDETGRGEERWPDDHKGFPGDDALKAKLLFPGKPEEGI